MNSCRVTAIVHHSVPNGINHSRALSIGSDGSHHSTDESDISSENHININNNNNNNNTLNESPIDILQKVKLEEERLRDERKRLEEEHQKLRLEMQKLELEKKELERRKQSDECQSLCSVSSASNSSSGSQSIGFLDEIKAMADRKAMLRPVNRANDKPPITGTKSVPKCDNSNDKHKQHELLMEEFRRAHRRMFGVNGVEQKVAKESDNSSTNETKETVKATKSLPIGSLNGANNVKIPPPVPKKSTVGPMVQIGTYCDNTLTNNRFVKQNHKSVIQVIRSDDKETNGDKVGASDGQITIKVISNNNK